MSFSAIDCGWCACIADRYQRRADVLNRGFSGYNTDWFLRYASTDEGKADLFQHNGVKLVTIFFGANDASCENLNRRQHVSLGDYTSNIKQIVSLARSNFGNDVKIVLMSPPPVCHDGRLRFQKERYKEKATGSLERTLALSGTYAKTLKGVANELNLPFLDLWTTMQFTPSGEEKPWKHYLSDGLHLSAKGNKFVGEALLQSIEQSLPELSVQPCPVSGNINSASQCSDMNKVAPWHDEIDHDHPEKVFESN